MHMEHSYSAKFLVKKKKKKKNGLGLLEKERSKKARSQTRTLSRGHSRRPPSHRSGAEQKFHTNYTGRAKPRCFCNCLCSPAQKRKGEKIWALMMTKRSRQTTKGESVFGLGATGTKDRMCSCLMATVTGSAHVRTIKTHASQPVRLDKHKTAA